MVDVAEKDIEQEIPRQPKYKQFTGMFERALAYALQQHTGQYRKSTNIPYIWHPFNVARNVEENKKSTNLELLMTAAVLHDTVEDCPHVTIQEIANLFGYKVAAIVEELTSDSAEIATLGKTEYLKQKMGGMSAILLRQTKSLEINTRKKQ